MSNSYLSQRCRTAEYVASPEAVSAARKEAAQSLKDWRLLTLIDTAELLVSELMTNAVQAIGFMAWQTGSSDLICLPRVMLQLRVEHNRLFVLVWDSSPNPPTPQDPDLDDEGGRGLQLVADLSLQWGYYVPNVGGKVVWCQLPL